MLGPFTPSDSLRVYRLQRKGVSLALRRSLTQAYTPLWEAWLAFLTQQAMGQPTYVLYDPHDGEAFVQIRYRPHQAAADMVYLAPELPDSPHSANAWSRLLDGACMEAAGRGIQRVFASLPDSGEVDVFQQGGFAAYSGEDVYRLTEPATPPQAVDMPALRPQRPEDWPAIQKLCVSITPQQVRQVEGGITVATRVEQNCRRYVLTAENGVDLVAMVDLYPGELAHWLRLLVHPDARDLADSLVRWAVEAVDDRSGRPTYCNVRQYESGVRAALENAGFEVYATRTLMVRHTMAWIRVSAPEMVPGLQSGAEALPPAYHINGEPEFQPSNGQLAAARDT